MDPLVAEVLKAQLLVEPERDILQLKVEPEQETAQLLVEPERKTAQLLAESEQDSAGDYNVHSIGISAYQQTI